MRFPSIKAVAARLREINTQDSVSTVVWSGIEDDSEIEVRLCIEDNGEWSILWGDSSYDQRHSPICSASSVPGDNRRFNSAAVARDLLEEARDQHAEQKSYEASLVTVEPLIHPQTAVDSTDPAVIAVADAAASGLEVTPDMLVGLPATICHPNDRYASKIVYVSPSLKTLTASYDDRWDQNGRKVLTFRRDKLGVYRAKGGSPRLHIGHAENHRCQEI